MDVASTLKYWLAVFKPVSKPKSLAFRTMHSSDYEKEIRKQGWNNPFGMLDGGGTYRYTSHLTYGAIFADVFMEMPCYITDFMDCEDFAILFKGLISARYGINTFGFAVGPTENGEHGFNFFRSEFGIFLFEPNPKFAYGNFDILNIGERGYRPRSVLV